VRESRCVSYSALNLMCQLRGVKKDWPLQAAKVTRLSYVCVKYCGLIFVFVYVGVQSLMF